MRGWTVIATVFLLSACVTPPPTPDQQRALFGPVLPAPSEDELASAKRLRFASWLNLPTLDEMHMAWPRDAWEVEALGDVMLSCIVQQAGHLACRAQDDGSKFDFEQAALFVSTRLRVAPFDRYGQPTAGQRVDFPMRFRLH